MKIGTIKLFITSLLIILLQMNANAQRPNNYSKEWAKIEALEKNGLYASSDKLVKEILKSTISEKNDVQLLKASMYHMNYQNQIEEESELKNVLYLDTLLEKIKNPARSIVLSMKAELLWNYVQNNRYDLYDQTALLSEKSNDYNTWGLQTLHENISDLYLASIKDEEILQKTSLDGMEEIIQKGTNTRQLRPTLFDLLAFRAFEYFKDDEANITKPAYKFIINDPAYFGGVNSFINLNIQSADSSSNHLQALKILQKILKFHSDENITAPFIDADLARLEFVNEYGSFTEKEKLYEQALIEAEKSYKNNHGAAQFMYLRALLYNEQGEKYKVNTNPAPQFKLKVSKILCEEIISGFPKSEAADKASNLLAEITKPNISIQNEQVNIPGKPFRALVKYKNAPTIHFFILKIKNEDVKYFNDYNNSWVEKVLQPQANNPIIKKFKIDMPDMKDHQEHSVEMKIDALPVGTYALLASLEPTLNIDKNLITKNIIYVSNISYLVNNQNELYVLNRETGFPLAKAAVQLWQNSYNSNYGYYELIKKENYVSDNNGLVKLQKDQSHQTRLIEINYQSDRLFTEDNLYSYPDYSQRNDSTVRTFLFTDRSIYRPGQAVFFKGIVVKQTEGLKKSVIVENYKTSLILLDANRQKIAEVQTTTNQYGSYNGKFQLPEGLLNGVFTIRDSVNGSEQTISVEEYKRPKFYAEIKKPEGTYRVNDLINVTGFAKAYAGNNISDAKVTYRVTRKVQYPIWWGWGGFYRIPYPMSNEPMEITNGETKTNDKGEFSLSFKAIPDEQTDKKNQPTFYYEVTADVTDLNGETRATSNTIAVAYQMIQLDIESPALIYNDNINTIKVRSTNYNGLFEKTNTRIVIQQLDKPNKIFRERYWDAPDLFVMSKEESYAAFPNDPYADEDKITKWPLGKTLADRNDSTSNDGKINLGLTKLNPGWYKFSVFAKDKNGEDVYAEKFIQVVTKDAKTSDKPIEIIAQQKKAEPGQQINYQFATGFDKIWLIQSVIRSEKNTNTNYPVIANKNFYSNKLDISEQDRGGINVCYAFIKNNRTYNGSESFEIPWSNKELSIQYETFRDKLLPGSSEKWKIKIKGDKAEKIATETLISMYDTSLDQFKPHSWSNLQSLWPTLLDLTTWYKYTFGAAHSHLSDKIPMNFIEEKEKLYDDLLHNGWSEKYLISHDYMMSEAAPNKLMMAGRPANREIMADGLVADSSVIDKNKSLKADADTSRSKLQQKKSGDGKMQIRKNFNETAFFFPTLMNDEAGNIEFSFTIPEALTEWKMMSLAHTKELSSGYSEKKIITQKELMIQPNVPRFLRGGDKVELPAKLVNLSDNELTGNIQLELFDAATNKSIQSGFDNQLSSQSFTLAAGHSKAVFFPISIPVSFTSILGYRFKASTIDMKFSDGEESAIPVLSNRIMVTESVPLYMNAVSNKTFAFDKLLKSGKSKTLQHQSVTVEYSSNPAWYAVQALPYMMEYPYECAEQQFNRYYSNALAAYICEQNPSIKSVFEKWKTTDTSALLSNLQKNEELKSALLQETPWVLEATDEATQKKNIALLFDLQKLSSQKENVVKKLTESQNSSGGFSWFKGGSDNRFITQYIITGIGHLLKLNVLNQQNYGDLKPIVDKAIPYLDKELQREYDYLLKNKSNLKSNNLSYSAIQYLYMRSFFPEMGTDKKYKKAVAYYHKQAQQYWLSYNKYMQGMMALSLHRMGDKKTPKSIIKSLKETSLSNESGEMYWKEFNTGGYYWHQAPIESQAMMIETFSDIDKDEKLIDAMKTWLLRNKQTQNWKTTKATAEACYALLLSGSKWLNTSNTVSIKLGDQQFSSDDNLEAGTGYFKNRISGDQVLREMGNISVSIKSENKNPTPSWGAVYWQYWEEMDKIESSATGNKLPIELNKKLYIEKLSDRGAVLVELKDGDKLQVGDKVKVRIILKADRDMEYLHMKDLRAACLEPVNVLSEYKWQGGLGYYESTKDASTNFFFDYMRKGTYVFEYPLFVNQKGTYSNGITTICNMYAPEFSSHSEGLKIISE